MDFKDDNSRWKAIVSRDPKASGIFVYAPKSSSVFCRPDCTIQTVTRKSSVIFFDDAQQAATKGGLKPCTACNPDLEVNVDRNVIESTLHVVNASIGLDFHDESKDTTNPSNGHYIDADSNDYASDSSIQQGVRHARSSSTLFIDDFEEESKFLRPRRASIASGHIGLAAAAFEEIKQSHKNNSHMVATKTSTKPDHASFSSKRRDDRRSEGNHVRLVDEACRHIAAAAAAAAVVAGNQENANSNDALGSEPNKLFSSNVADDATNGNSVEGPRRPQKRRSNAAPLEQFSKVTRKKRRGGILGFKELAAKAGLSPWHFHRVFRSVTGLTPKAYGDACWNAVTSSIPSSSLVATAGTVNHNNNNREQKSLQHIPQHSLPLHMSSSPSSIDNIHHIPTTSSFTTDSAQMLATSTPSLEDVIAVTAAMDASMLRVTAGFSEPLMNTSSMMPMPTLSTITTQQQQIPSLTYTSSGVESIDSLFPTADADLGMVISNGLNVMPTSMSTSTPTSMETANSNWSTMFSMGYDTNSPTAALAVNSVVTTGGLDTMFIPSTSGEPGFLPTTSTWTDSAMLNPVSTPFNPFGLDIVDEGGKSSSIPVTSSSIDNLDGLLLQPDNFSSELDSMYQLSEDSWQSTSGNLMMNHPDLMNGDLKDPFLAPVSVMREGVDTLIT